VPVLLAHGTDNRAVPLRQGRRMAEALRKAGRTHRYIELKDEDHLLSHGDTRLQHLRELDAFLDEQLR